MGIRNVFRLPEWPAETLESVLQRALPELEDRAYSAVEVRALLLQAATVAIFNERAAVMKEPDLLSREFDAAGRENTAKRVRETAAKIDARFR